MHSDRPAQINTPDASRFAYSAQHARPWGPGDNDEPLAIESLRLNKPGDRPPVLKFLALFAALLGVALALAMLAPNDEPSPDSGASRSAPSVTTGVVPGQPG